MTDLEQYLKQTKQTISDDGFTEKVVTQLPVRRINWDKSIQAICYTIILLIIVFGGGIDMLREILSSDASFTQLMKTIILNSIHALTFIILSIAAFIYNFKDRLDF